MRWDLADIIHVHGVAPFVVDQVLLVCVDVRPDALSWLDFQDLTIVSIFTYFALRPSLLDRAHRCRFLNGTFLAAQHLLMFL